MPPRKGSAAATERAWALSKRLSRMTGFRFMAFCIAGTLGFIADVAVLLFGLENRYR